MSLSYILAFLKGTWYYLILILLYVSLLANDLEHLFLWLFAIYILFSETSSAYFLFGFLLPFFLLPFFLPLLFFLSFILFTVELRVLYFLDTNPLLDSGLQIFSPSV